MKINYIQLELNNNGSIEYIYPSFIKTEKDLVLIDAGYPGMLDKIDERLKEKGYGLDQVTELWLSQHDHDHVGSLKDIKTKYPEIIIKASEKEIPHIDGSKIPMRLGQALKIHDSLTEEEKIGSNYFMDYLKSIEICDVDEVINYGEMLLDGRIEVIETEGHTVGHISFYDKETKTLISADALVMVDDEVMIPFLPICV